MWSEDLQLSTFCTNVPKPSKYLQSIDHHLVHATSSFLFHRLPHRLFPFELWSEQDSAPQQDYVCHPRFHATVKIILTLTRFALRRAALRIVQQPTRQLSTIRPTPRPSPVQSQVISSCRSFHQTLRWAAEEESKPAEEAAASPAEVDSASDTVTAEPSAADQTEIKEESIATQEVADPDQGKSAPLSDKVSEIVSQGKSRVESAFATGEDALARAAQTVQRAAGAPDTRGRGEYAGRVRRSDKPPSRVLYAGNLFFEVTTPALEAEFARFGEIVNSRIVTDARGMSKGFGYIEFAAQADADAAIQELDQKVFQGRRMAVQYHSERAPRQDSLVQPRSPAEPSKTLFIGNMSYQMSDRDLNGM